MTVSEIFGKRSGRRRALAIGALTWAMLLPTGLIATPPAAAGPAALTPAALTPAAVVGRDATLVPTPPMGFNGWNAFGCDVNAELIEQTADIFVSSGLKEAGYQYVNIDDCWSLRERGADGRLVPDPVKFPDGISGVADYVHSRGLKLGIYGDAGTKTCAGYPGSLGTEELDARTWAEWGVDYLKYDNCYNQSDGSQADFIRRYTAMRDALDKAGRPIVYSICEWGQSQPWLWATGVGDLWRTTGDFSDNWASLRAGIAHNAPLYPYAGPGHFNDPDMLQIGNGGMTDGEYRTHMSMWAMMAAPLLIGTDLREASAATMEILSNREIIAVDQDPLGVQATVVSDSDGLMVLDKPLENGDRAIAFYNSTDTLATVNVAAAATGLKPAEAYRLQDLWSGGVLQSGSTLAAAVPAHGTVVYRVRSAARPATLPPAVTVGATLGPLVPGTAGGTLTSTITNRGYRGIHQVSVSVRAPEGWTVTATSPSRRPALASDAALATTWTVRAPEDTGAGRYPITVTAQYRWGPKGPVATTSSELISMVVTAPTDGRRHLSTVAPVSSVNAVGPAELDQSNGGAGQGDGALITIGGRVYTRGLGTTAPAEIVYYLGGSCSHLVSDVGIDDEAPTALPATFTVHADDTVAAASGPVAAGEAPKTLTADLTGATWLRLVTAGSGPAPDGTTINNHADWAQPILTCGASTPSDPVLPTEQTLFSFESGTEGFTVANADPGGSMASSTAFHTDGERSLEVTVPSAGNWFGRTLAEPIDLSGRSGLKVDVKAATAAGTTGEIAVQVGPGLAWCQGGRWAWTNANSSRTIAEKFTEINCPTDVTLDLTDIRAVWIFINGTGAQIDNIRAE